MHIYSVYIEANFKSLCVYSLDLEFTYAWTISYTILTLWSLVNFFLYLEWKSTQDVVLKDLRFKLHYRQGGFPHPLDLGRRAVQFDIEVDWFAFVQRGYNTRTSRANSSKNGEYLLSTYFLTGACYRSAWRIFLISTRTKSRCLVHMRNPIEYKINRPANA